MTLAVELQAETIKWLCIAVLWSVYSEVSFKLSFDKELGDKLLGCLDEQAAANTTCKNKEILKLSYDSN